MTGNTMPPETEKRNDVIEQDINTDDREQYDWESSYPEDARKEILGEAIYVGVMLLISLVGLVLNWCNVFSGILKLDAERIQVFEFYGYYFLSGLLGGTIFGIKYFYRVVARGYWSQDRRYWRIFSPWISACIALIVGCMVMSGYISATSRTPGVAVTICVGFVAGYFADKAVGKMSEVATALFGNSEKSK